MDRVAIEKLRDELIKELETKTKGTDEFTEITTQIRNLEDVLSKDIAQEETRAKREEETRLKEKELEVRLKGERSRSIWAAIGAGLAAGLTAVGGIVVAIVNGKSQDRRIDKLKTIKEDQGIIDRDVMNVR